MAFPTILTIVIILYVLGYTAMIVYDLFLKKDPADLIKKSEDEDVDIADEAGRFKPTFVNKDEKPVVRPIAEEPVPESAETAQAQSAESAASEETDSEDADPDDKYKPQALSDDEPTNRKSLSDMDGQDSGDVDTNATDPEEGIKEEGNSPQHDNSDQPSPNSSSPTEGINPDITGEAASETNESANDGQTSQPSDNSIDTSLPMVRIVMDTSTTRLTGAVNVDDLVGQVNEFAEKGKDSRLGQLKVIAFAEEEKKRIEEMAEALRLREEARKNGKEQDTPAPPPGLDIGME